jgi:hypothetical protein
MLGRVGILPELQNKVYAWAAAIRLTISQLAESDEAPHAKRRSRNGDAAGLDAGGDRAGQAQRSPRREHIHDVKNRTAGLSRRFTGAQRPY